MTRHHAPRRPGFRPDRVIRRMVEAVARVDLELAGLTVLTEAATGPFAVTASLAGIGGAERVLVHAGDSRFGTAGAAFEATLDLARRTGTEALLEWVPELTPEHLRRADIVTNSGHLRPLDAQRVEALKSTAVIPLMYEGWEHRPGDVDRFACEARHIPLLGTNERNGRLPVFPYLGPAAVHLLTAAGIEVLATRVLLLCDNPFASYLEGHLRVCGATVESIGSPLDPLPDGPFDALLVACTPRGEPVIGEEAAARIAQAIPGTPVVQFWGDLDRASLTAAGLPVWPPASPGPGRMGILLSDLGPEPAIRLQLGGLKVGEIMARERLLDPSPAGCVAALRRAIDSGFGSRLAGQLETS